MDSKVGPLVLLFVLTLPLVSTCATGGKGATGPLEWPAGEYELRGSVSYRTDTSEGRGSSGMNLTSRLFISEDGSMVLRTPQQPCRDRFPAEITRDLARRERTFHCVDVKYVFRPRGDLVQATAVASVIERVREARNCISRNPGGECTQYSYSVERKPTNKSVRLRVVKRKWGVTSSVVQAVPRWDPCGPNQDGPR